MGYQPPGNNIIQLGGPTGSSSPGAILPVGGSPTPVSWIANCNGGTQGNYYTFVRMASGAGSQVTSGKTFYCTGIMVATTAANAAVRFYVGYGTAAVDNSATAPTGAVPYMNAVGVSSASTGSIAVSSSASAYNTTYIPCLFSFGSASYPFLRDTAGAVSYVVTMLGYEV